MNNWNNVTPEKRKEYAERHQRLHPEKVMLKTVKHRAKKRGMDFDLEHKDIVIPSHCPILGIELKASIGEGNGGKPCSPSIDRIDNNKGYVKGNIQVVSNLANSMKSTATPEQMLVFANWIYKTYG